MYPLPCRAQYPFRLAAKRQDTFPKGTAFGGEGKVHGIAKGVPLGELANPQGLTEGVTHAKEPLYKKYSDS